MESLFKPGKQPWFRRGQIDAGHADLGESEPKGP